MAPSRSHLPRIGRVWCDCSSPACSNPGQRVPGTPTSTAGFRVESQTLSLFAQVVAVCSALRAAMQTRSHRLIEIPWLEPGEPAPPPEPPATGFERRLALTRTPMGGRAWTQLAVYGDREHFANLAWLTQLDPRFEEMLLVIGLVSRPLLIVGNECEGRHGRIPSWGSGARAIR